MPISFASNAVLTKTRAMFGKRLMPGDYNLLLAQHSVSQVAGILKQHPGYEHFLDDINEGTVHRLQLEERLRQKHFENFESFARYELSAGEKLADYIIRKSELELIIEALTRIKSANTSPTVFFIPAFLDRHIGIDTPALEKAQTFEDLLQAVRDSFFYETLLPLAPTASSNPDIATYENILYSELYQQLFRQISRIASSECRKELTDMIVSYLDLENLVRIYRLKVFFNASPEYILNHLLPGGSIPEKRLRTMTESPKGTLLQLAQEGKIHPSLQKDFRYTVPDELPKRYLGKISIHNIRYSDHPPVVMLSYLYFSDIEISNIIKIVEGCRYQLPAEQVRKMLIL